MGKAFVIEISQWVPSYRVDRKANTITKSSCHLKYQVKYNLKLYSLKAKDPRIFQYFKKYIFTRPQQIPRGGKLVIYKTASYHQTLLYTSPLNSQILRENWWNDLSFNCQLTPHTWWSVCWHFNTLPLQWATKQKYWTSKICFFFDRMLKGSKTGFITSLMYRTHIKIHFAVGLRIISTPNHIRKQSSRKEGSVKMYKKLIIRRILNPHC